MLQNVIILVFTALAVFVLVVAQPIQDMSEVSITHKTVGIHLPRLWCRAGLVCRPADHSKRVSSSFFPFVHGGVVGQGVSGVFDPRRKRSKAEPMS